MINKSHTILVTGATGLVGSHVIRLLIKEGYTHIRALKRHTSRMDLVSDFEHKVTWYEGDMTDIFSLESAVQGSDAIIHTAAVVSYDPKDRQLMDEINIGGTAHIVNLALEYNVKRFVHLSSVAALGKSADSHIKDEQTEWDDSIDTTDYAISKYKSEKEVWRAHAEGLPVIIFNPSFILGAGYWQETSTAIWSRMDKGIPYYPVGTNGYVDVKDVAKAIIIGLESIIDGERYIISAETLPYKTVFEWIANAIGAKVPSKALTPLLRTIAWRLDWLRSIFTGSSQLLTKASAKSTSLPTVYDSNKSVSDLGINYHSIKDTIQAVGYSYLQSKKEGKDYGTLDARL